MNPNFNRKGFLALTGGVSLAAFLAACGGGSDSGSSSAGGDAAATTAAAGAQSVFAPATEPGGPIEIFTWAGYDDTEGDGAPWMWADYEASEYGTESPLKFTFLEDDTQALAKVASGYSPDVMHPCVAWVPQWKAAGVLAYVREFPDECRQEWEDLTACDAQALKRSLPHLEPREITSL